MKQAFFCYFTQGSMVPPSHHAAPVKVVLGLVHGYVMISIAKVNKDNEIVQNLI